MDEFKQPREYVDDFLRVLPGRSYAEIAKVYRESTEALERLVAEANRAFNVILDLGSFYDTGEPTPRRSPKTKDDAAARKERTLAIAQHLASEGVSVTTDAVAGRLRAEGFESERLNTSIGNVLNRNGWTRDEAGVYTPPDQLPIS